MVKEKRAFWQALVYTAVVFGIGLVLGFVLENSRTNQIENNILKSEINLLDEQIRNRGIEQFSIECEATKESTYVFADEIYEEALQLEKYDSTNKFSETLTTLHKRYDLLRVMLWMEGIELKEQCDQNIHTVVYIFDYGVEELDKKARQNALSRLLLDLKNAHGEEVLLIPIAGNLNLKSVDLILDKYEISQLPVIIIDEEKVITGEVTLSQIEDIIFERNNIAELEGELFSAKELDKEDTIFLN